MNKAIKLTLVLSALFLCSQSYSQKGRPSLGIGLELGLPTGDLSEISKLGIGGSLKAAFPVATDFDITASAGFISFAGKEIVSGYKYPAINLIPLKVGARYRFAPGGFYVEPQLGYTIAKAKGASDSDGAFTYAGNLGYMINNQWDISARYEGASKDGGTLSHAGLRLAYTLPL